MKKLIFIFLALACFGLPDRDIYPIDERKFFRTDLDSDTVLGDIVAGVGLSGGADNVLPGADVDTTLTFDATQLDALTWSDGANVSNIWTFNVSGTDPTMTFGSGFVSHNGDIRLTDDATIGVFGVLTFIFDSSNNDFDFIGGDVGIGTTSPETVLELTDAEPYLTLQNSVSEDTDGDRESRINFKGLQSGAEETTLARIEVSHDGAADDEKGKLVISVNDGNDGDTPTDRFKIDAAGVTHIGDGTNEMQISGIGDVLFVGGAGLVYANMYAHDNATPTTITTGGEANKVQIVIFNANGLSDNMTPDHNNDHITVVKAGHYIAHVSITASGAGGDQDEFGFGMWKNNGNTEFPNVHGHRNLAGGAGDIGSIHLSGIVDLAANDTIEVWCWNEDDTDDVTIDDISLSLIQIGGT